MMMKKMKMTNKDLEDSIYRILWDVFKSGNNEKEYMKNLEKNNKALMKVSKDIIKRILESGHDE